MSKTAAIRQKLNDLEPRINDAARAARIAVLLADHVEEYLKSIGFEIGEMELLRHATAHSRNQANDLMKFYYDTLADVEE
jgi:hypothetical protein